MPIDSDKLQDLGPTASEAVVAVTEPNFDIKTLQDDKQQGSLFYLDKLFREPGGQGRPSRTLWTWTFPAQIDAERLWVAKLTMHNDSYFQCDPISVDEHPQKKVAKRAAALELISQLREEVCAVTSRDNDSISPCTAPLYDDNDRAISPIFERDKSPRHNTEVGHLRYNSNASNGTDSDASDRKLSDSHLLYFGDTHTQFPTSNSERIQLGEELLKKRRFSAKINNLFKAAIAAERDLGFVLTSGTNATQMRTHHERKRTMQVIYKGVQNGLVVDVIVPMRDDTRLVYWKPWIDDMKAKVPGFYGKYSGIHTREVYINPLQWLWLMDKGDDRKDRRRNIKITRAEPNGPRVGRVEVGRFVQLFQNFYLVLKLKSFWSGSKKGRMQTQCMMTFLYAMDNDFGPAQPLADLTRRNFINQDGRARSAAVTMRMTHDIDYDPYRRVPQDEVKASESESESESAV
jgi:hypothetical protein